MQTLLQALSGRTSIVIAHRLATIKHCDQVAVVERGRIEEIGSYREVLGRRGRFERLHRLEEEEILK